jgi:hypothetical protein
MKKIKILLGLSVVLLMAACTKETTIKEEYNPPQPKLYGTWKMENNSTSTNEYYYVFTEDGSNYVHTLVKDNNGFKYKESSAFKATDKQINMSYYLYNYDVVADTLTLYNSPTAYSRYFKVLNPSFTPSNWTGSLKVLKTLELPRAVTSNTLRPFGIEGDYLYLAGNNGSGDYVYKFNSVTKQHVDSINVVYGVTTYFKSPNLYYAFESKNKIFKTTGIASPSSTISINDIDYTRSISVNASSGVIYAFTQSGQLYSGTENATFNMLFDFNPYSLSYLLYDKNDEFMVLRNGMISRLKISPAFNVIKSYDPVPNFYTYSISSNGVDTWLYGYNNMTSTYQLLKVSLN